MPPQTLSFDDLETVPLDFDSLEVEGPKKEEKKKEESKSTFRKVLDEPHVSRFLHGETRENTPDGMYGENSIYNKARRSHGLPDLKEAESDWLNIPGVKTGANWLADRVPYKDDDQIMANVSSGIRMLGDLIAGSADPRAVGIGKGGKIGETLAAESSGAKLLNEGPHTRGQLRLPVATPRRFIANEHGQQLETYQAPGMVDDVILQEHALRVEPKGDIPLDWSGVETQRGSRFEPIEDPIPHKIEKSPITGKPLVRQPSNLFARTSTKPGEGKASLIDNPAVVNDPKEYQLESAPKFPDSRMGDTRGEFTNPDTAPRQDIAPRNTPGVNPGGYDRPVPRDPATGNAIVQDADQLKKAVIEDGIPTLARKALDIISIPKGFLAGGDFAPLLRQGINYAGRPAWWRAWISSARAYASEGGYKAAQEAIQQRRLVKNGYAQKSGLDIINPNQEEAFMNTDLASKIFQVPGRFGVKPIRASSRAFSTAMNDLRSNVLEKLYDDYTKLYKTRLGSAKTAEEIASAEHFNPDNPIVAKKIGQSINTATGRGSLGMLKREEGGTLHRALNATFFSPKLVSSRLGTIKKILSAPLTKDPIQRKEAIKELASIAGMTLTMDQLYGLAGAKSGLPSMFKGTDENRQTMNSPDFGHSRFGNISIDNSGGYGRYVTLADRLATNKYTSGKTGEEHDLNTGKFGSLNRMDMVNSFIENMHSPVISLMSAMLSGEEIGGKAVNFHTPNPFENTATKQLVNPMIAQDIYDIVKEDPYYLWLLIPDAAGASINVYSEDEN